MGSEVLFSLLLVVVVALIGGTLARWLKLTPLLGYIVAGIVGAAVLPLDKAPIESLAELGIILLLFSVGLELSLSKLAKVGAVAFLGGLLQIVIVAGLVWFLLVALGIGGVPALVLASGFTLSSTAIVVKILGDRGELETIHGEIMVGWLLIQDLAVIPITVFLPVLVSDQANLWPILGRSLGAALLVISAVFFLGRLVTPFIVHAVAARNSRELLVLTGVSLAMGTAYLVSKFGISAALGAFLAGVVISETQENHAIFAETRPLRDLFVILFFVSLGFLVDPLVLWRHLPLVITLALGVMVVKTIVVFLILLGFGYKGKTATATSLGLSQIGEFSFVIFLLAKGLGLIDSELATVGIATTLTTLLLTPFVFKVIVPLWRKLKTGTAKWPKVNRLFSGGHSLTHEGEDLKDHIILCGYGRVGGWIGKALASAQIPFVVVDYNQRVVRQTRLAGIPVVYGDPAEPEVLEAAGIQRAKAIVVAIPDRVTQEELVSHVQTIAPKVRILGRAHSLEDWEKLSTLKINKVIQPEFEAAVAVVKNIFRSMGRPRTEIQKRIKSLRTAHSLTR